MPIYDFGDYETRKLKKSLKLYAQLDSIGFETDEDLTYAIQRELEGRKKCSINKKTGECTGTKKKSKKPKSRRPTIREPSIIRVGHTREML